MVTSAPFAAAGLRVSLVSDAIERKNCTL